MSRSWISLRAKTAHYMDASRWSRARVALMLIGGLGTGAIACSDSTGTMVSVQKGTAYIRIVNSVFQGDDPQTAVAVPIDFIVDSSTAHPSVTNIPPGSIAAGDSANGFIALPAGLHTFIARVAGDTTLSHSLYTSSANTPWLPKMDLTGNTYYTIVLTGTIPTSGPIPGDAIPWIANVNDPFAGDTSVGVVQARFSMTYAAPYTSTSGRGAYIKLYLTPGATPPANLSSYAPYSLSLSFMSYPYTFIQGQDIPPGTYTATITDLSGKIFAQQPVTFTEGEVKSFILQSTAYSATPGTGNSVLQILHDH